MKAYVAKHITEDIRMKSRSGGAFFAIAQRFMDRYNGVVYGCYFDIGEKTAKHIRIDNSADLPKLQGSKYVQSDSSEGMKQALIDLHNGKKVLFSGTACQVAGIISACPKVEKNNLFTLDIVCRGIPSPGVCTAWLNKKMESIDDELVQFDFRNKSKFGWAAAKETIYTNSKQYDSDEYAKLFYGHNMIRPSCYKCLYRGLNRVSDITLGDAWGVGEADFFDEKGISLVLVNSNRGEKMMEDVDLYVREVDIQNYMQPALTESFKEPADRNAFWRKYHSSDILDVMLFENGTGLFKVKRYVRKAAYQLFRRLGKNDENLSK